MTCEDVAAAGVVAVAVALQSPPAPPPPASDAQDRDEEIARILEDAKRRGREEPGAITILVPSRKG